MWYISDFYSCYNMQFTLCRVKSKSLTADSDYNMIVAYIRENLQLRGITK